MTTMPTSTTTTDAMVPQKAQAPEADANNAGSNGHQTTRAWTVLSRLLPSRDADSDYWWATTGHQLACMVDAAGYSMERQLEALVFHYHWAVSRHPNPAPVGFDQPLMSMVAYRRRTWAKHLLHPESSNGDP